MSKLRFSHTASHWDAFFFYLMVGLGETYFVAFSLELGFSAILSGLLIPISMLVASVFSFFASGALTDKRSIKKFVVLGVFLQSLSFLLFIPISRQVVPSEMIYFAVTLYFFFGFIVGPAWNAWLSQLVTPDEAPGFFQFRMRISQVGLLLGIFVGGLLLHEVGRAEIFLGLFALAMLCRLASFLALNRQPEVPRVQSVSIASSVAIFFREPSYRWFFGFLFIFYIFIYISSPFVNPFLLKTLKLPYLEYMMVLAALFLGKILILPFGATWMRKFRVRNVLMLGALGISPLPLLWIWVHSFWGSVILQFVSGMFWALFEIAFSILFFNHIRLKEKIPLLSMYNIFNSAAIGIGSLAGALLLREFRSEGHGFDMIFGVGSALRLIFVGAFLFLGIHHRFPENSSEPELQRKAI